MNRFIIIMLLSLLQLSCSEKRDCENAVSSVGKVEADKLALPLPDKKLHLETYGSCSEIEDHFRKLMERSEQNNYQSSIYSGNAVQQCMEPTSAAVNMDGGVTNQQVQGVDERDIVKASQDFIFVSKPDFVEILDKKSLEIVQSLNTEKLTDVGLFYKKGVLVVLGIVAGSQNRSQVRFYSIKREQDPQLKKEMYIRGRIIASRQKDSTLSFVANESLVDSWYPYSEDQIISQIQSNLSEKDCRSIYKPMGEDSDFTLSTVHQFDLQSSDLEYQQKSLLGSYSEVYMSKDNLYLTRKGVYQPYFNQSNSVRSWNIVVKMGMKKKWADVNSVGHFPGSTIGPWAYSEENGTLAVATTTGMQWTGNLSNHLFLLRTNKANGTLENIGSVTNFGKTEDIRSVRYMNNKAYIVTFKKTDPLFIIDIKDPYSPQMMSELKAPGFSRYMHSLGGGQLLGLGYGADDQGDFVFFTGVQLSLFDISDDYSPSIIEQQELGDRGSFSDVLFNHQAFYYNDKTKILGFPIVEVESLTDDPWGPKEHRFSGAKFFKVNESGFLPLSQSSHVHWMDKECTMNNPSWFWWSSPQFSVDINRIFETDNRIFSLSRFGIVEHDLKTAQSTGRSTKFHSSPRDCRPLRQVMMSN